MLPFIRHFFPHLFFANINSMLLQWRYDKAAATAIICSTSHKQSNHLIHIQSFSYCVSSVSYNGICFLLTVPGCIENESFALNNIFIDFELWALSTQVPSEYSYFNLNERVPIVNRLAYRSALSNCFFFFCFQWMVFNDSHSVSIQCSTFQQIVIQIVWITFERYQINFMTVFTHCEDSFWMSQHNGYGRVSFRNVQGIMRISISLNHFTNHFVFHWNR